MRLRLFITISGVLCRAGRGQPAISFRPGEKMKYGGPGEEEISGNAQQLYDKAQEAEKQGNVGRAIKAYTPLLKKHPKDALAPGATYRAAQLLEFEGDYMKAAMTYRWLVERYPSSPNFDEAIEAQFRVGEMYLSGKKIKMLGIPIATSLDRAVEIFAAIVRTAPFGRYTARAQFDIGLARQKQSANDAAIQAYQAVIDKFPNDPTAADAQYQVGYIWYEAARLGTNDQAASQKARTAVDDFVFRSPKTDKASHHRNQIRSCRRRPRFCHRQRRRLSRPQARSHRLLRKPLPRPSPPPRLILPLRRRREKPPHRGLFASYQLPWLPRGAGETRCSARCPPCCGADV